MQGYEVNVEPPNESPKAAEKAAEKPPEMRKRPSSAVDGSDSQSKRSVKRARVENAASPSKENPKRWATGLRIAFGATPSTPPLVLIGVHTKLAAAGATVSATFSATCTHYVAETMVGLVVILFIFFWHLRKRQICEQ